MSNLEKLDSYLFSAGGGGGNGWMVYGTQANTPFRAAQLEQYQGAMYMAPQNQPCQRCGGYIGGYIGAWYGVHPPPLCRCGTKERHCAGCNCGVADGRDIKTGDPMLVDARTGRILVNQDKKIQDGTTTVQSSADKASTEKGKDHRWRYHSH